MRVLPTDPWGHDFHYIVTPGREDGFGIYSLGANGITFSDGNDPDDLNTWNEKKPLLACCGVELDRRSRLPYLVPIIVVSIIGLLMFLYPQKRV